MRRRTFLRSLLLWPLAALTQRAAWARTPDFPTVASGQPLAFPRDYGAHSGYRNEWWYVTGWLQADAGAAAGATPGAAAEPSLGFEATFFRSRLAIDDANPSRFAPNQLLFANVALSDPHAGSLQHGQRAARRGFGLAEASETDTAVHIDDWSLERNLDGLYRLNVATPGFAFAFTLRPTQPMLVNGAGGYSRKGPLASEASYYYSEPGLTVDGVLRRGGQSAGKDEHVLGQAWLDHEWSSSPLADVAVGWDWIGIDLEDGGALMAFQIRDKAGRKFWAGGTLRAGDGSTHALSPDSVSFTPLRRWRSPHTGAVYPVAMRVDAQDLHLTLVPLMDDQEFDGRASTGAVYWEGAVTAFQAGAVGASSAKPAVKPVGRGYLELTGYVERLAL
ncbi:lipocalin-like domain-containing protein [Paraburkholderia pallida]|uniref:Carotenoid 1,2-hydratase n=1 Tax=Paraburkholderia pallida TaxID=2547399 RepID=A0A4P7D4Z0_9BURK|nr:lipocalin-like domain-containing protein [Paraburkholderia pallida]QBR01672.1 carotenoid 1,2-hydratase [Paraburkholderia pallida]